MERRYRTADTLKGPLLFLDRVADVTYGALVTLELENGEERSGQVVEIDGDRVAVQLFGPTGGIRPATTLIRFRERGIRLDLSPLALGRIFNGAGKPLDGAGPSLPMTRRDIHGSAINPLRRDRPAEPIITGVSAIDGLNTLVKGQKLPIFSGAGLPADEIARMIVANAGTVDGTPFALVFAGIGVTSREGEAFTGSFHASGAIDRSVVFLNHADDPVIERLLTPRLALTMAEYLAFDLGMDVLVVMTDMTNYANAVREISSAKEEIPGRRGYPGYLYTDLAEIYERAGRIKGRKGSVTQLPILTMPDDDITHPIPDLTGYITEGQIVLDRGLTRKGVFPPINTLQSLSRLMDAGIGEGRTREDHRQLADQLYMLYARGLELREVASLVSEEGLTPVERQYLSFADRFESEYVGQRGIARSMEETLAVGWRLLATMPASELVRLDRAHIDRYLPDGKGTP